MGFGGLLIGQNGSRGKIIESFSLSAEIYNFKTKQHNRGQEEVCRRKICCCDFAVKFSTTKQNIIVEKNCFQEAQNYTFWLVLEKAYREKNVINFALAFIKIVRRRTLLVYHTVVHFFHCFNDLEETKDFYGNGTP